MAATDTQVTPPIGTVAPPGMVMSNANDPAMPTMLEPSGAEPSTAIRNRDRSMIDRRRSSVSAS